MSHEVSPVIADVIVIVVLIIVIIPSVTVVGHRGRVEGLHGHVEV